MDTIELDTVCGHLARQCANRWKFKVTKWTPRTFVRRRGRQSRQWTDELREHAGVTWQRKAQNRHWWKMYDEAFLLQWSEIGYRRMKVHTSLSLILCFCELKSHGDKKLIPNIFQQKVYSEMN